MPSLDVPLSRPTSLHVPTSLQDRYAAVRLRSERLTAPLVPEDLVVSSMPDVSPTKWHLAHTTWFFETFVLGRFAPAYRTPDARYAFLFNSYYVQAGERHCRAQRGLVTRPTVEQVFEYRAHVDDAMTTLITTIGDDPNHPAVPLVTLGLHHEEQHQELMATDIKHVFWTNPMRPAYGRWSAPARPAPALHWREFAGGLQWIGHDLSAGFAYDNEGPRHRTFVEPYALASRCVTNGEFLAFVEEGGYTNPLLWLSNGWATVQASQWRAPFYWEHDGDEWQEFTLAGLRPLDLAAPACHLSFYEADAFARWAGARLPTEAEWELAASDPPVEDAEAALALHPAVANHDELAQLYGAVWQFTASPYVAYPGFRAAPGAIGEYNGKFMCDQWVLRGSSCATPPNHTRRTYRNFFPADARWQFTGLRLARSA